MKRKLSRKDLLNKCKYDLRIAAERNAAAIEAIDKPTTNIKELDALMVLGGLLPANKPAEALNHQANRAAAIWKGQNDPAQIVYRTNYYLKKYGYEQLNESEQNDLIQSGRQQFEDQRELLRNPDAGEDPGDGGDPIVDMFENYSQVPHSEQYTIHRGDTIWDISQRHQGVTVDDIIESNPWLKERRLGTPNSDTDYILIKPGEKINIPANDSSKEENSYIVSHGDTLWEIGEKYGLTVDEIIDNNRWLESDGRIRDDYVLIKPGEKLNLNIGGSKINYAFEEFVKRDIHEGDRKHDHLTGGIGNDILIGNRDNPEVLKGGKGDDYYHAYDKDIIEDSDGKGKILFDSAEPLIGGKQIDENTWREYGGGGTYRLIDGTLEAGVLEYAKYGKKIIIKNFTNGDMGICLSKKDEEKTQNNDFSSPIVLDLDNDNQTSISIFESNAYFDLDGDDFKEMVGWVDREDGLLALDKDANGTIDNGNELFGNYTRDDEGHYHENGYDALAAYDDNADGKIDRKDEVYSKLRVWIDQNQDGTSQSSELHTIDDLKIQSISLNAEEASSEEARNQVSHVSTFTQMPVDSEGNVITDADGNPITQEKITRDVWFRRDTQATKYDFDQPVPADITALPEISGSGRVMNLSHAMTIDADLQTAVERFLTAGSGSLNDLYAQADVIIAKWTHTEDIDPNQTRGTQYVLNHNYNNPQPARTYNINARARDVAILESFWGKEFQMTVDGELTTDVIGTQMAKAFAERIDHLLDTVVVALLSQSLFGKAVYDAEAGYWDSDTLYNSLQNELMTVGDPERRAAAGNLLAVLVNRNRLTVFDQVDPAVLEQPDIQSLLAANGITLEVDSNGEITGRIKDKFYGGDRDDVLFETGEIYGGGGDDSLVGGNGHDTLYGGDGDDRMNGHHGNDLLYGGAGNDTLRTGGGYGHDVLEGGRGDDWMGGSYRSSTYVYRYGDGHDVIEDQGQVGVTPDVLQLKGIRVDDIDAEKKGKDLILNIRDIVSGDSGTFSGSITIKNAFSEGKIERFEFEDNALDFNQMLEGQFIYDNEHTYRLEDLAVEIEEAGGTDRLVFLDGITPDQILVKADASGDNMIIAIKEEGKNFDKLTHKITLIGGFLNDRKIEEFVFADGSVLDFNTILQRQIITESDDILHYGDADDVVQTLGGDDIVKTGAGDDSLSGGRGQDRLEGGAGNDHYVFNPGDGKEEIHDAAVDNSADAGRDILQFGEGIGADDLIIGDDGRDIIIGRKEEGKDLNELSDTITIKDWYNRQNRVETFIFADGTSMDESDILTKLSETASVVHGLETDDAIEGSDEDNIIFGRGGNDTLTGRGGNDHLYGESGDDTLAGNAGDDLLSGGGGHDRYVFNRGDGQDEITDEMRTSSNNDQLIDGGIDTLAFGSGIRPQDIVLVKDGSDIVIALKEDGKSIDELNDRLKIHNWYESRMRVEKFEFEDGTTLSDGEFLQLMGTSGDDEVAGVEEDSIFTDTIGEDSYSGLAGNDIYRFSLGGGRDTITDIGGTDKVLFGDGINPQELKIVWEQGTDDIVITYTGNESDELRLTNWYRRDNRIEQFEFSDGTLWGVADIIDAMGTMDEDVFNGVSEADNTIHARGGGDIISTYDGDDILYGGEGADALDSQDGNDVLIGESGDDSLWGGAGNDTYVFSRGDGRDLILDHDKDVVNAGLDTLQLGAGISKGDLIFKIDADNNRLYVGIADPTNPDKAFDDLPDLITIENWYVAENRIEQIELTDSGETLHVADIMAAMGTDGNDTIKALAEGSDLDSGAGNDTLWGNVGNDSLSGGSGDDLIEGRGGLDELVGGQGDDLLNGGAGSDRYRFNRGDGRDTVLDLATETIWQYGWVTNAETGTRRWGRVYYERQVDGGYDRLIFGEGITPDDLAVRTEDGNVIIGLKEEGKNFDELADKITIQNYFDSDTRIEQYHFADGQVLNPQEIIDLLFSEASDTVAFDTDANLIVNAKAGDDTVFAGAGDDIITGGAGNDVLDGGRGNDIYVFGRGDGQDTVDDRGALDWWQSSAGRDEIRLTGGLTADDVVISWGGNLSQEFKNDLVIGIRKDGKTLGELNDRILIKDWFNKRTKIEAITFEDGTVWDAQAIMDAVFTNARDQIDLPWADTGHTFNTRAGDDTMYATGREDTVNAGAGDDTIHGVGGEDVLNGQNGDDTLVGDALPEYFDDVDSLYGSKDQLSGGAGEDTLIGAGGNDTLAGGADSDVLYGGAGNDRYVFNRGDGIDTMHDDVSYEDDESQEDRFGHSTWATVRRHTNGGSQDEIVFGEGITPDDVFFLWPYQMDADGNPVNRDKDIGSDDLVVAVKDPTHPDTPIDRLTDRIIIKDFFRREIETDLGGRWYDSDEVVGTPWSQALESRYLNRIEMLRFADGTTLSRHALAAALSSERDDRIEAAIGEDSVLYGLGGNDVLNGDTGDDALYGGEGHDRLSGGYGENMLDGGGGDDIYVLSAEDMPPWEGHVADDVIVDSAGVDKVMILNDISREDILFTVEGNGDLLLTYGIEQQHRLRIEGNAVERFETSDGSFITREQVMAAIAAAADQAGVAPADLKMEDLAYDIELKTFQYNAWTDGYVAHTGHSDWNAFAGNSENEIVAGGQGEDDLLGHSGNDTLHGRQADDYLNAGNGNDTYIFSRGDDNDTILDAENPLIYEDDGEDYDEYGYDYFEEDYGDDYGDEDLLWEYQTNQAPSNDSLVFKGDVRLEDLEAYWATDNDDWQNRHVNDLFIRVNPQDKAGTPADRQTNIDTILDFYATRPMNSPLTAKDLAPFSDKAIRQLAYRVDHSGQYPKYSNYANTVINYLEDFERQTTFNREYREDEDTVHIEQFYDRDYTIENLVLEDQGQTLSNNDLMDRMATDNTEMIRGVDWAGNTIDARKGDDAVLGGEQNDVITGGQGKDYLHGRNGNDDYHFNRGDGRDQLTDGHEDILDVLEGARYWEGYREADWGWGEESFAAFDAPADGLALPAANGGPNEPQGDAGGYDRAIFGQGISVRNVGFAEFGGGLYVGYGALADPDDYDDLEWWIEGDLPSAAHYGFSVGYPSWDPPRRRIYENDMYLPNQYDWGRAIEEFGLADGARISWEAIDNAIWEMRDYIWEHEEALQQIEDQGGDARGYVDRIIRNAWYRVDKAFVGTAAGDVIDVGDGDDTIEAGGGDDVIIGGFGADTVDGGAGNDNYVYNRWDGADVIVDASGLDTLRFGPGIALSDLVAAINQETGDLVIGIVDEVEKIEAGETGYHPDPAQLDQRITIRNWRSLAGRLESFSFAEGETLTAIEVYNHFFATELSDNLAGLEGDNTIDALGGDDQVRLGDGNHSVNAGGGDDYVETLGGEDTIHTGHGADTVFSGAGDDVITTAGSNNQVTAGAGADQISGGEGDDFFHIGIGDGNDRILDQGGLDAVVVDGSLVLDDVVVEKLGDDVSVTLKDGSTALIKDWALPQNHVENIHFEDGTQLAIATLLKRFQARNYALALDEDSSMDGRIDTLNAEGDLAYSLVEDSANGTFTLHPDGTWSYQPGENYAGDDRVVVSVTDVAGNTAISTIQLDVAPVNDAPEAPAEENHVLQNVRELAGEIAATDAEGDALGYAVSQAPAYGTLSMDADGNWTYTPDDLFMGEDTAAVTVSDGNGSETATTLNFEVRVSPPSLADQSVDLDEDTAATDVLRVDNPIGGALTWEITRGSEHGQFDLDADGRYVYMPASNYNGSDSVTITVTNAYGLSDSMTLAFDVAQVNDTPDAPAEEDYVLQDVRVLAGAIAASDVDGDVLDYAVSQAPANGTLNVDNDGNWTYTPDDLFMGEDTAVVKVSDGNGGNVNTTLNFEVKVSPPSIADQSVGLDEDTATSDVLSVENPIGGTLTFEVTGGSGHGQFELDADGRYTYTPADDYYGGDSVAIKVTNAYGLSDRMTLAFDVAPENDAPKMVESEDLEVFGVVSLTGQISAHDVDGDRLSYLISEFPQHGSLSVDAQGQWAFIPEDGYTGTDRGVVMVEDGHGGYTPTTLNFTINVYTGGDRVISEKGTRGIRLDDVSKDDLQLMRQTDDLLIAIEDKGSLALAGYFAAPDNGLEWLQTLEGSLQLDKDRIAEIRNGSGWRQWQDRIGRCGEKNLIYGSPWGETLMGGNDNDVLFGAEGHDLLLGARGDETLVGGDGHDHLWGWQGDDTLYGDRGRDYLSGGSGSDALVGGDDDDRLDGGDGDDWLFGDAGNDRIDGSDGNDILNGGLGDDVLKGGRGDDIYRFNPGDGHDSIHAYPSGGWCRGREDDGLDTVQFAQGVGREDVAVFMRCGNLYLKYGEEDTVEVRHQKDSQSRVARIALADGSHLTDTDINQIVQEMSAYAVEEGICLRSVDDVRQNQELMAMVTNAWQPA